MKDVKFQLNADKNVVKNLKKYGDGLTQKRDVDHFFYFSKSTDRDLFINKIKQDNEFVVTDTYDYFEKPNEYPYGVTCIQNKIIDLKEIQNLTPKLMCMAIEFNGKYDGWGCPVIRKDNHE